MKKSTLFLSMLLASTALSPMYVLAASADSSTTTGTATAPSTSSPNAEQTQAMSNIMGDINIAMIALVYNMNDDASTHINAAREAIGALNSQTSSNNSSVSMNAGKLSYKTAQGKADTFIPVVNERFADQQFSGKHLTSKTPDIDVVDAESVHYNMFLDTKMADDQLAKAQTALSQKQYDVALIALQGIAQASISETVVDDMPMQAARDNLIVSRELLREKDYRGASFALKHANMQLARVEKDNPQIAKDANIKDMRSQIDSLRATISKDNPSILKEAEQKIEGWIKDIKADI